MNFITQLRHNYNLFKISGFIAGPACFLLLISFFTPPETLAPTANAVIALGAWMVIWWLTEAVPLFVTALLPLVFFPLLGIADMTATAAPYANPIIFLFMGGFLIALGMEKRNLHTRIALNLIRITGTHANGIILGFMLATAFLSMWISNTATTVMMLPIALSVVNLLRENNPEADGFNKFALALMLCIAYSANIGGTATIIGTPPNVVLLGYMKQFYQQDIEFGKWLLIGVPFCITMLAATFFLTTRILFRHRLGRLTGSAQLVREKLRALGAPAKAEKLVGAIFFLTAICWIFQQNINEFLCAFLQDQDEPCRSYLNNTNIAMAGGVLMFITPVSLQKHEFVLDWKSTERLPWGILLLFGGGLCLANGMEATGIIQFAGNQIAQGPTTSLWILMLLLTTFMLFMTELMSNVALTVIFVPVVLGIADSLQIAPALLAIPVTLASSCAFMMPVSTPPNAVVFSSGYIKIIDMVKAGFFLNVLAILLLLLLYFTLLPWVF